MLEPTYDYLGGIYEGLSSFRENDKYGFIDIKGDVVIKPQFDWVDEFSDGFCVIRNDNRELGSGENEFINKDGEIMFDKQFEYASKFENGKAKVQIGNEFVFINKVGEVIQEH